MEAGLIASLLTDSATSSYNFASTISPGPASQFIKQVSNSFTVNVIFYLSLKSKYLEYLNRNEPKQYTNTWQIMEVSN